MQGQLQGDGGGGGVGGQPVASPLLGLPSPPFSPHTNTNVWSLHPTPPPTGLRPPPPTHTHTGQHVSLLTTIRLHRGSPRASVCSCPWRYSQLARAPLHQSHPQLAQLRGQVGGRVCGAAAEHGGGRGDKAALQLRDAEQDLQGEGRARVRAGRGVRQVQGGGGRRSKARIES